MSMHLPCDAGLVNIPIISYAQGSLCRNIIIRPHAILAPSSMAWSAWSEYPHDTRASILDSLKLSTPYFLSRLQILDPEMLVERQTR